MGLRAYNMEAPYENEEGDVVVFVVAPSLVGILGMGSETLEA